MFKFKNILIFVLSGLNLFFLIIFFITKISISKIFSENWNPVLTIFTAFILIIITIVLPYFQNKDNKNKLFSELIEEYSHREMLEAIRDICKFAEDTGNAIEFKMIDEKNKIHNQINLVKKYIELAKKGKIKINKNIYTWDDLDYKRRLIANYFVKANLLTENHLINKKLINDFWSVKSLQYLSDYIIPLEYVALPVIYNFNLENNLKPGQLMNFYNKYIAKNISNEKLEIILDKKNCFASNLFIIKENLLDIYNNVK